MSTPATTYTTATLIKHFRRKPSQVFYDALCLFLTRFRRTEQNRDTFDKVTSYGLLPQMFSKADYDEFALALYLLEPDPSEFRALMRLLYGVLDIDRLLIAMEDIGRFAQRYEDEAERRYKAKGASTIH